MKKCLWVLFLVLSGLQAQSQERATLPEILRSQIVPATQSESADRTPVPRIQVSPYPGSKIDFHGFDSYRLLDAEGTRPFYLVVPKQVAPGKPWLWCGAFWGDKMIPATEWVVRANLKLVEEGYFMVFSSPTSVYGYPEGNQRLDGVYAEVTGKYGLAKKAAMIGLSRETLFVYRWASHNPDKVACIYLDNGVCDFKSWPGGFGKAKRDLGAWELVLKSYGFNSETEALAYNKNPIDILKPLAEAKVPILHVVGDVDAIVPYAENAAIIEQRYAKLGGPIQVIHKEKCGHHPHGLKDPEPILTFIRQHTSPHPQLMGVGFSQAGDPATGEPSSTIFVAPNGCDSEGNGTSLRPFQSILKARDSIRNGGERRRGPIQVVIRGGLYELTGPMVFEPVDSGREGMPITYRSYPGERAVLSGGRRISSFTLDRTGLWVADLPAVREGSWTFDQLWVNGERAQRARTPNTGYHYVYSPATEVKNQTTGIIEDLSDRAFFSNESLEDLRALSPLELQDVMVHLYDYYLFQRRLLCSIRPEDHLINMQYENLPQAWRPTRGQRYHLENYRAALDQPGEWYLSREGKLFYKPLPGQSLGNVEVIAPMAEKLLELKGDRKSGKMVEHLAFKDLDFRYVSHGDIVLGNPGYHHFRKTGTDTEGRAVVAPKKGYISDQSCVDLPGAIHMTSCKNIQFVGNSVSHLAAFAILIERDGYDIDISRNNIYDLGAGGIRIGNALHYDIPEDCRIRRVMVDNNIIFGGGRIYTSGPAILLTQASDCQISHNDIADFFQIAVSAGWSWVYGNTDHKNNHITWNRIRGIGRGVMDDLGAIYTLGESDGTLIANNVIYDVSRYRYGGWGLYNDQASRGITMRDNLVFNTEDAAYHLNWGSDLRLTNNIFGPSRKTLLEGGGGDDLGPSWSPLNTRYYSSVSVERNVFIRGDNGTVIQGSYRNDRKTFNQNLYLNVSGEDKVFDGLTLGEWQKANKDNNCFSSPKSPSPAPLNGDIHKLDQRLLKKINFQPFEVDKAGVYGDREWIKQGRNLKYGPPLDSTMPELRPLLIRENFDDLTSDQKIPHGKINMDLEKGATIAIVSEAGPKGTTINNKCLRFHDTVEAWQPNLKFSPMYQSGIAHISFDIKLQDSARFLHSWQDRINKWTNPVNLEFRDNQLFESHNGKLMALPPEQWIHIDILCGLGKNATRKFELSVTLQGEKKRVFKELIAQKCENLSYVEFGGRENANAKIYLDNLLMEKF